MVSPTPHSEHEYIASETTVETGPEIEPEAYEESDTHDGDDYDDTMVHDDNEYIASETSVVRMEKRRPPPLTLASSQDDQRQASVHPIAGVEEPQVQHAPAVEQDTTIPVSHKKEKQERTRRASSQAKASPTAHPPKASPLIGVPQPQAQVDYEDLVRDLFEPHRISVLDQVIRLPLSKRTPTLKLERKGRDEDEASRERAFIPSIPQQDRKIPAYNPILDKHCTITERESFKNALVQRFDISSGFEKILNHRIRNRDPSDIIGSASVYQAPVHASGTGPVSAREMQRRRGRKDREKRTTRAAHIQAQQLAMSPRGSPIPPISPSPSASPRHKRVHKSGQGQDVGPLVTEWVHQDMGDNPYVDWALVAGEILADQPIPEDESGYTDALNIDFLDDNFERAEQELEAAWEMLHFPESARERFRQAKLQRSTVRNYSSMQAELASIAGYKRDLRQLLRKIEERSILLDLYSYEEDGNDDAFATEGTKQNWREQAEALNIYTARVVDGLRQWKEAYPWNHTFVYNGKNLEESLDEDIPSYLLRHGVVHSSTVLTGTPGPIDGTSDRVGPQRRNQIRQAAARRKRIRKEQGDMVGVRAVAVDAELPPHLAHVRPHVHKLLNYRQLYAELEAMARLREEVLEGIVHFVANQDQVSSPSRRIQSRVRLAMDLTREAIGTLRRLGNFDNHLVFLYKGRNYAVKLVSDVKILADAGLITETEARDTLLRIERRKAEEEEKGVQAISYATTSFPLSPRSRRPSLAPSSHTASRRTSVAGSRRTSLAQGHRGGPSGAGTGGSAPQHDTGTGTAGGSVPASRNTSRRPSIAGSIPSVERRPSVTGSATGTGVGAADGMGPIEAIPEEEAVEVFDDQPTTRGQGQGQGQETGSGLGPRQQSDKRVGFTSNPNSARGRGNSMDPSASPHSQQIPSPLGTPRAQPLDATSSTLPRQPVSLGDSQLDASGKGKGKGKKAREKGKGRKKGKGKGGKDNGNGNGGGGGGKEGPQGEAGDRGEASTTTGQKKQPLVSAREIHARQHKVSVVNDVDNISVFTNPLCRTNKPEKKGKQPLSQPQPRGVSGATGLGVAGGQATVLVGGPQRSAGVSPANSLPNSARGTAPIQPWNHTSSGSHLRPPDSTANTGGGPGAIRKEDSRMILDSEAARDFAITANEQAWRTAQIVLADLHDQALRFNSKATKRVTGVDHVPLNAVYANERAASSHGIRRFRRLRIDEHGHRLYPELDVTLPEVHTHLAVDFGKV